jgi:hypothetical protein
MLMGARPVPLRGSRRAAVAGLGLLALGYACAPAIHAEAAARPPMVGRDGHRKMEGRP